MSLDGDRTKVRAVTTYVPDDKSAPQDSDAKSGAEDAEARHAEAEGTKDVAPAGDDTGGSSHWDHYASEAVLAGDDPEALVDPAKRAGLTTRLELMEQSLEDFAAPVHPDIRAGLSASLSLMEDDLNRAKSAIPAGDRTGMTRGLALLEDDLRQPTTTRED